MLTLVIMVFLYVFPAPPKASFCFVSTNLSLFYAFLPKEHLITDPTVITTSSLLI